MQAISRSVGNTRVPLSVLNEAISRMRLALSNSDNLSRGDLESIVQAVKSMDRDTRKFQFPKKLMTDALLALRAVPVCEKTFPYIAAFTSELTNDKSWDTLALSRRLSRYFLSSKSSVSDASFVDLLKAVAAAAKMQSPEIEEVEEFLRLSLDFLENRTEFLSGEELIYTLTSIVLLRRSRNFTATNHYRRRECNVLLSGDLLGRIRNQMLEKYQETPPFHLTLLSWNFASLGVWSVPLMEAIVKKIHANFHILPMRDIGIFLWGFAVAGHPLTNDSKKFVDFCQFHFHSYNSGMVDPIIPWSLEQLGRPWNPEPGVKAKEFPEQQDQTRVVRSSALHAGVSKSLGWIGLNVVNEVEVGKDLNVDIAIEIPDEKIPGKTRYCAIEVDGPNHFVQLCDGTRKLCGASEKKMRDLRALGWEVISVDVKSLSSCESGREREIFLRTLIPTEWVTKPLTGRDRRKQINRY